MTQEIKLDTPLDLVWLAGTLLFWGAASVATSSRLFEFPERISILALLSLAVPGAAMLAFAWTRRRAGVASIYLFSILYVYGFGTMFLWILSLMTNHAP